MVLNMPLLGIRKHQQMPLGWNSARKAHVLSYSFLKPLYLRWSIIKRWNIINISSTFFIITIFSLFYYGTAYFWWLMFLQKTITNLPHVSFLYMCNCWRSNVSDIFQLLENVGHNRDLLHLSTKVYMLQWWHHYVSHINIFLDSLMLWWTRLNQMRKMLFIRTNFKVWGKLFTI